MSTQPTHPVQAGGPDAHPHDPSLPLKLMPEAVPWYGPLYVLAILVIWRVCDSTRRHNRFKKTTSNVALVDSSQATWRTSLSGGPQLKKWLFYAPLWTATRAQRISGYGTLPTRLQALAIVLFWLTNLSYLFNLDWEHEETRPARVQLMGRSGCAMTANIIPLIVMAARNNPLERLLRVSHDTHILMHRWIGRMICFDLVIHVVCWTVGRVGDGGWQTVADKLMHSPFITAGFIGLVAAVFLFPLSLNSVRRTSYEFFLNTHIFLGLAFLVSGAIHCHIHRPPLPQIWFFAAAISLWVMERLYRFMTQLYCSWTFESGPSIAAVEALSGDTKTCRITVELRRHLNIRPGAHAYLRLETVEPWASHPSSIAWTESTCSDSLGPSEKPDQADAEITTTTTVSFIVGARKGFTRKLYEKALSSPQSVFRTRATFEGPYGGHDSLKSHGHVVLFAGATGICHQLRHVHYLAGRYQVAKVSARRVVLVWIMRDMETFAWTASWLRTIQCPPGFLDVRIFVTRSTSDALSILAPQMDLPSWVSFQAGRPHVSGVLAQEVHRQVGAMSVVVCGPGGLADDVRSAVRVAQDTHQVIDFLEESFSW